MIRIYRRHVKSCPHTSERERRCRCPIHCEGVLGEERIKPQSLKLSSWEAATKKVREWEAAGTTKAAQKIKLSEAILRYKADCEARGLAPSTQRPIRVLLGSLQEFPDRRGLRLLESMGVDHLREFRESWATWARWCS